MRWVAASPAKGDARCASLALSHLSLSLSLVFGLLGLRVVIGLP